MRSATIALNAALATLDLPPVAFYDLDRHDELLGIAFVGKHNPYLPLAEYIAQLISDTESA